MEHMAQVLQDAAEMAISFERSRGYSLPSLEINQTKAYSSQNPNSNQQYRTNKLYAKETWQPQPKPEKFKSWECQGDHLKKDCPMVKTSQGKSKHSKFNDNKERQYKLFKSFQKKILNKKESVNEIAETSNDDISEELWNQFFTEFEKLIHEEEGEVSDWLQNPHIDVATINKLFMGGFHALYHLQIGELKTAALLDTGASINAISSKFFRSLYQQLKIIPTNRKVVSADGNSLGAVGKVNLKFKLGKVIFIDRFAILDNLKWDIIPGLPWLSNYRIGCDWNKDGKHFLRSIFNQ